MFIIGNLRPKEPKYVAEELWNKLLEANSDFNLSNKCIVYDGLNEDKEYKSLPISNIIQKLQVLMIKKIDISKIHFYNMQSDLIIESLKNENKDLKSKLDSTNNRRDPRNAEKI